MEEKIDILRKAGIERILKDKDLRALFHEVALKIFGQNCLNCDGKIREQYSLLLTKPYKMESKYKLKKDDVISMSSPDWKEDLSNANMTDKKAEALLNRTLKYIFRFEEAPNIEELRIAAESGVKTLDEAMGKTDPAPTYSDELTDLKGIGDTTAEKIVNVYPTKDLLLDAIEHDVDMAFLGRYEDRVKEALKAL